MVLPFGKCQICVLHVNRVLISFIYLFILLIVVNSI